MKKEDSGILGYGITTLLIFVYGLKTNRGWKYWVFSLLFVNTAGWYIGYALGAEKPYSQNQNKNQNNQLTDFYLAQKEKELCRERECKDKGGMYRYGKCEVLTTSDTDWGFSTIELKGCK